MILSGWKEIAGHLRCGVRTVQRWETHGLPVHRPLRDKRSQVIAYSEELDWWIKENEPARTGPEHVITSIAHSKRLCAEARKSRMELRLRMEQLRRTIAHIRSDRSARVKKVSRETVSDSGQ